MALIDSPRTKIDRAGLAELSSAEGVVAFDDRYADLYALACRVARKWTQDPARAADVAQETMVRTYARWSAVASLPYLEAWVGRVAANVAIGEWRRRARHAKVEHLLVRNGRATDSDAGISVDVRSALAALPRRQREVVVLRYIADQSERDVAAALGCTVGTVSQHASRGLAALRASLGDYDITSNDDADVAGGSAANAVAVAQKRRTRRRVAAGAGALTLALATLTFGLRGGPLHERLPVANSSTTTTAATTTAAVRDNSVTDRNGAPDPGPGSNGAVTTDRGASSAPGASPSQGAPNVGAAPGGAPGGASASAPTPASGTTVPQWTPSPSPGGTTTTAPAPALAPAPAPAPGTPPTTVPAPSGAELGFFGAYTPTRVDPDTQATEVGMRFYSDVPGVVTGVRFYKFATNTGTHVGTLWDGNGNVLARVTFTNESDAGWQHANFSTPVAISPGSLYVVSYLAPNGQYASEQYFFTDRQLDVGVLHAPKNNGVYVYGGGFPTNEFAGENYYVEPVFVPA